MEATLNILWVATAAMAFLLVPRRSWRTSLALLCAAAFLFPIVSASDDLLNADRPFNDVTVTLVVSVALAMALVTIARLRAMSAPPYIIHVASPSDPRSPPAR